jgi:single-strand DNA-binding protein
MMNYNRVILVGRLTRDPELRTTPDGVPLVRCSIAVNRRTGGEEVADFFDFVAFRQNADFLANYATKGRLVLIEGRLQSRSYTDREGVRRTAYEIMAERVYACWTARVKPRPEMPAATQAAVGAPGAAPASPARLYTASTGARTGRGARPAGGVPRGRFRGGRRPVRGNAVRSEEGSDGD